MIRIDDDWVIDVDENNYILKKDLHSEKKRKDGTVEHNWKVIGYYSSPDKALKRFGEEIIRNRLRGAEMGLPEAVRAIRESMKEWSQMVERIVTE